MTLDETLFQDIKNDLLGDFPNITSISREENNVIIKADKDTLWEIYDVLHKGTDIELNLDRNDDSYISLTL